MASKYTDMIAKLKARNEASQKMFAAQNAWGNTIAWTPNIKKKQPTQEEINNSFKATNSFYEWLDPASQNQVTAANNSYDAFFQPNQALNSMLDQYLPWMSQELANANWLNLDVFKDVERQFNLQRENVLNQYWPEWDMTNRIKNFYGWVYDTVNNWFADAQWALNQARDLNTSVYQGNVSNLDTAAEASWASWAQLAASKRVADENLAKDQLANAQATWDLGIKKLETELGLRQQEMQDYNNLYQNLNTYLDQYIQNYWNSRDKYLVNNFNNLLNVKSQLQQYLKQLELQNKALATDLASWQVAAWQPVTATNPYIAPLTPKWPTYETWVTKPYDNQTNSWVSQGWYVYPWNKPDILLNKNINPYKISEVKNPYSPKLPTNALANIIPRR